MLINATNLQNLYRSYRTLAYDALNGATPMWDKIAMMVPSSTAGNDYGWLQDVPGARQWIGERELKNLSGATYSIKNLPFELTVAVKRTDIEDDNIGIYAPMFSMLGDAFAYSPDQIVFDLLKGGFTQVAYDNIPFFGTHKIGKTNFANKETGKLTRQRLRDALAKMQGAGIGRHLDPARRRRERRLRHGPRAGAARTGRRGGGLLDAVGRVQARQALDLAAPQGADLRAHGRRDGRERVHAFRVPLRLR
jgi:Mu-like prophage major head subunit gpT